MKDSQNKSHQCFPVTEAIDAYVAIRRVHDSLNRIVSKKLKKQGMSVPKYGVVRNLYDHESLPLSELSNLIFRGNSNVTSLIKRMERDGLVERINCEKDSRVKRVRLTEKGRQLAPQIISEHRAFLHQMIMNCIGPDDQRMLIDVLNRLRKSL
jgi:DNA-binding MarR family transcriptional regulator